MQNRLLSLGCALALLGMGAPAWAAPGSVLGDWNTPAGLKVHVAPCAANRAWMCGALIGMKEPNDKTGAPLRDAANADASLRARPLIGIQILIDLKPNGSGAWSGGKVYELNAGKTYDGKMTLNPDGTLKVEGCVAVICRGVAWTRAG